MDLMELEGSQWAKWAVPAIGVLAAGLVLACGRWLSAPRRQNSVDPAVKDATDRALADPFLDGSRSERRKALRRGGTAVGVLISDAEGKAQPHQGWVVDRSTGGLRVAATQSAVVGTVLSLRPSDAPQGTPWIQVEVTNCTRDEQNWEIGCRFLRTPSWNFLLLFG